MQFKITKMAEAVYPDFKSAEWKNYALGRDNGEVSLPLDYTLEGSFILDMKVGGTMFVARTSRNGVKAPGQFMSSVITKITEENKIKIVTTRNSVYLVEEIKNENAIS